MKPKSKDENAKDPHWKIPVDLPGVDVEAYPKLNENIRKVRKK